jgi:hypothetical protein
MLKESSSIILFFASPHQPIYSRILQQHNGLSIFLLVLKKNDLTQGVPIIGKGLGF